MHPDLEDFLESAFQSVAPTSPSIGRVVVEPDYDCAPSEQDAVHLASELVQTLQGQTESPSKLTSHQGQEIEIPGKYRLLALYIRRITLHADKAEGPWVEV